MPLGKKKKKKDVITVDRTSGNEEKIRVFDYRAKIAELFLPRKNRCYCCKPARLSKSQIQEEWEGKMDNSLSLRVYKYLFPKKAKEISFPKFCDFYADLVEKDHQTRAKTICKLSNVFKEDPLADKDTTMDCLLKVVSSIVGSFFDNMLVIGHKVLMEWTGLGAINCSVDNYQLATSLCANIPIDTEEDGTISKVKAEDIAVWISNSALFEDISCELFKSLFGIPSENEINTYLPYPVHEAALNNTLLALPNVLILNHYTRKRQAKKWISTFSTIRSSSDTWENFLSSVRGKGPTLIVVQDRHGGVFGMYASQKWFEDENFYGNDESFLFTLKPEVNMYTASGLDGNFQFFDDQGVGMGGEKEEFGLFIDRSLRKGFSAEKCKTFVQYSPLSSESEFEIKTIEIWTVSTATSRQSASFFLTDDELEAISHGTELIKKEEKESDNCAGDEEIVLESTSLEDVDQFDKSIFGPTRPKPSQSDDATDTLQCACGEAGDAPSETTVSPEKSNRSECLCDTNGATDVSSPDESQIRTASATQMLRRQLTFVETKEESQLSTTESPQTSQKDESCRCSPVDTLFPQFAEDENTTSHSDRTYASNTNRTKKKLKMKMIRPNVCKCTKVELLFPKFTQQDAIEVFYEDSTGTTLVQ